MATHEIQNILHKYTKETVQITNVRLGLICSVCGHHWGIALDDGDDLLKQSQRMICLPCYQKSVNNNAKDGNYEYSNTTQYQEK